MFPEKAALPTPDANGAAVPSNGVEASTSTNEALSPRTVEELVAARVQAWVQLLQAGSADPCGHLLLSVHLRAGHDHQCPVDQP